MKDNPEANSFFASPRSMGTFDSVPLRDLVDEDDVVEDEEIPDEKSD